MQVYQVMRDTFQAFYLKYGIEFDEESVMTAFFDSIQEIESFSSDSITKAMICGILGLEIDSQELKEWEKLFTTICSNPKYQWVYNKLSIAPLKICGNNKHKVWMDTYMKGNHCKKAWRKILCKRKSTKSKMALGKQCKQGAEALPNHTSRRAGRHSRRWRRECRPGCWDTLRGRGQPTA